MEYSKIQSNDFEGNDKNTMLLHKSDDSLEINNENTFNKINNMSKLNRNILLLIILLLLFLIFVQQKNVANITKIIESKNLTIADEEKQSEETPEEILPLNQDIYKIENFDSRKKSFQKALKFLENNIKGNLTEKIPKEPIDNPIASAVIPVYNSKNYIEKAVRSIQNQNIKNIEIILVNDNSTDDSLNFIQNLQKEDQRIKIIDNKQNKGILYSRCVGTLAAKGKYIFPLDNDDMFLDKDVFQVITNIAEKGFFDIVELKGIYSRKGGNDILKNRIDDTFFCNHPLNLVLYQPELGNYAVWPKSGINSYRRESVYLWAKCIKTEIYHKTIHKLGEKKYNRFILRYEDVIMVYALFNMARSYKFVGKYGIFYIYRQSSASRHFTSTMSDIYHIQYLDVMIDFVRDTFNNKKILVNLLMYILNRYSLKNALKKEEIKDIFIYDIDKILKMNKISEENKNEIRKKVKSLTFIEHSF